jgi:hypothetical protein
LREATKLAEAGTLTARLNSERFTFETALDAHLAVESGDAVGKVVIALMNNYKSRHEVLNGLIVLCLLQNGTR